MSCATPSKLVAYSGSCLAAICASIDSDVRPGRDRHSHSGYKKACAGKGVQAHFYFDEGKQAYYFFWNNNWIVSSEWVRHGDLLLPSAVDKWGCESPQKFKPTTKCPQKL